MINANEIRIGNLVSWDGLIRKVSGVNDDIIFFNNGLPNGTNKCSISDINEIQLTEEWLLKLGFTKDRYNYFKTDGFEYCVEYYLPDNTFSLYIYTDNDWHCIISDIEHVHQLQNLYFALTQTELKSHE